MPPPTIPAKFLNTVKIIQRVDNVESTNTSFSYFFTLSRNSLLFHYIDIIIIYNFSQYDYCTQRRSVSSFYRRFFPTTTTTITSFTYCGVNTLVSTSAIVYLLRWLHVLSDGWPRNTLPRDAHRKEWQWLRGINERDYPRWPNHGWGRILSPRLWLHIVELAMAARVQLRRLLAADHPFMRCGLELAWPTFGWEAQLDGITDWQAPGGALRAGCCLTVLSKGGLCPQAVSNSIFEKRWWWGTFAQSCNVAWRLMAPAGLHCRGRLRGSSFMKPSLSALFLTSTFLLSDLFIILL